MDHEVDLLVFIDRLFLICLDHLNQILLKLILTYK